MKMAKLEFTIVHGDKSFSPDLGFKSANAMEHAAFEMISGIMAMGNTDAKFSDFKVIANGLEWKNGGYVYHEYPEPYVFGKNSVYKWIREVDEWAGLNA